MKSVILLYSVYKDLNDLIYHDLTVYAIKTEVKIDITPHRMT